MQRNWQSEGPSSSVGDYTLHKDQVLGKGATGTVYRGTSFLTKVSMGSPRSLWL